MKNQLLTILIIKITLMLSAQEMPVKTKSNNSSHAFTESYKAPVFTNDDRIEKIKSKETEIQQMIEVHAKSNNIPGIAYGILVDGQLIISSATGLMNLEKNKAATRNSSFRIASMTKSFTAMAIMKLRDEGKLSLSDLASKYLPEMSKLKYLTKDAPIIDIENLLTMTAGFPEDNPWGDRQLDEPDQMLTKLIKDGISFSNASSFEFEYSNTGYAILGHIVSKVSGMPFQKYIDTNILKPLGMNHTYWEYDVVPKEQLVLGYRWEDEQWKLEPLLHDGSFGAMGGLITSIEDFSKYVSFHLSAWPPRNDEDSGPIKRSSLREMQTPQFPTLNANGKDINGNLCPSMGGYGFGLGTSTNCKGLIQVGHGGALPGFGSDYRFYPEYGIGIMAFCNLTYTSAYPRAKIVDMLFNTLDLKARQLPVSDILMERELEIMELIQDWNEDLGAKILAENFYLDKSRERRMKETKAVFAKAGKINSVESLIAENHLRGTYKLKTENGVVEVFFTLTPEATPKVQQLDISFKSHDHK
ncbi:MAG: serine hydrolase domain-containing protein [Saprospiraceae bacterium]